jgi:vacuolar-type H+-ATPase subunit C/Vma6
MMPRGSIAYAHARIRGCKSHLLTRVDASPLFTASDPQAMRRVVVALGLEDPMQRLLRVYATAIRGYPHAAPLFRALLQLHEMENVKLEWRRRRNTTSDFAGTPFAQIVKTVARAHGNDVAAAELALDRWASQRLLDEARRLPRREALARRLVELVVKERDSEIVRRGARWYGLTSVSGIAEDVISLRRERLRICHRAFVGSPFLLAPALAVILLAEEEVRAVRALVERQGDESLDPPLLRALAASELGA